MLKVYIDGNQGTTGLKIYDRLKDRDDVTLLSADESLRKDPSVRRELIKESDITFLCLPDDAAREAVSLAEGSKAKIIDASTAHRTKSDWAYGFSELSKEMFDGIKNGTRVSVPGCHASGFLSIVYPLVKSSMMPTNYPLICHSVTGYSGGGKKMIAEYEDENRSAEFYSPRQYATAQHHKHLPEMTWHTGLENTPIFMPEVTNCFSGMLVSVPIFAKYLKLPRLNDSPQNMVRRFFKQYYKDKPLISVADENGEYEYEADGIITKKRLSEADQSVSFSTLMGTDRMVIHVAGSDGKIVVYSVFDNLGKGASGAAVQCMNIMTGQNETKGLVL